MNKKFLLPFFVLAAILTLSSCSNKLKPLAEQYIKAEPQPLEAIGGVAVVLLHGGEHGVQGRPAHPGGGRVICVNSHLYIPPCFRLELPIGLVCNWSITEINYQVNR